MGAHLLSCRYLLGLPQDGQGSFTQMEDFFCGEEKEKLERPEILSPFAFFELFGRRDTVWLLGMGL